MPILLSPNVDCDCECEGEGGGTLTLTCTGHEIQIPEVVYVTGVCSPCGASATVAVTLVPTPNFGFPPRAATGTACTTDTGCGARMIANVSVECFSEAEPFSLVWGVSATFNVDTDCDHLLDAGCGMGGANNGAGEYILEGDPVYSYGETDNYLYPWPDPLCPDTPCGCPENETFVCSVELTE